MKSKLIFRGEDEMEMTYLRRYDWQPGNGTRYELLYGRTGGMWLITWLKHGGSAGPAMLFDGYIHYSYLMEKLDVNIADAAGILKFLEHQGIKVGYPKIEGLDHSHESARLQELNS